MPYRPKAAPNTGAAAQEAGDQSHAHWTERFACGLYGRERESASTKTSQTTHQQSCYTLGGPTAAIFGMILRTRREEATHNRARLVGLRALRKALMVFSVWSADRAAIRNWFRESGAAAANQAQPGRGRGFPALRQPTSLADRCGRRHRLVFKR